LKMQNDIEQQDIIDNLRSVDKNGTLLDILLEFEHVLDEQGIYAYKNWKKGEVAMGPKLTRHWLHVILMYPYLDMPNPKAGLRLIKLGCEVSFKRATLKTPKIVKSPEDLDARNKPKMNSEDVWLVDIWMPRKFVDEFTDEKVQVDDTDTLVNTQDLGQANSEGLDDETNLGQDV